MVGGKGRRIGEEDRRGRGKIVENMEK